MQQLSTLSLAEHSGQTEFSQARSEVYFDGQPSGIMVPGKVLEAAYEVDKDRCLVLTTDDVPFEESLNITLISREQGVIETACIGYQYASGLFENAFADTQGVHFQFIDDVTWTVKVSTSPHWRIPFFSDPSGVKRPFGFKTCMTFLTSPLPKSVA